MEVVASLSQGRTAAVHCGLFTHKSVPVIFEPPCSSPVSGVLSASFDVKYLDLFGVAKFLFLPPIVYLSLLLDYVAAVVQFLRLSDLIFYSYSHSLY